MQPATVAAWHAQMLKWRDEYRQSVKYNGTRVYSDPQLKWTQTSYMQPQMHPCKRAQLRPARQRLPCFTATPALICACTAVQLGVGVCR